MLVPTFVLLSTLWLVQTVLLGVFYANIKTQELKTTTETVINEMQSEDIENRILFLSSNGDINIRVIDTTAFESLYSSGETFDSVTYGWGSYGMWSLYEEALENGGEFVRYYSEDETLNDAFGIIDSDTEEKTGITPNSRKNFREYFEPVPRPAFFDNIGRHNDLLFAKIAVLEDGSEIMVVADTRISPLDSTVVTLRAQLGVCSVFTVILSLLFSFLIAKKISRPIEKINTSAKNLAKGNFDTEFDGKGYREIEELTDTLNYASRELGKVDSLRRELMANVSHDMRTPLTMIVGYAEAMRDIPGENNAENVQVIIDEANRLSEFVNSVLDLSRLQNGMEKADMQRANLTEILERTTARYESLLSDKDFSITFECDKHVFVTCDVTKITQVIHNLVDNAVNYANFPKTVKLCQKVNEKDKTVRVEITDNGDGIDHEELPYIWDRYYKTEKSHKRNLVGSGIGLSIVKEILIMHGARYGVETKIGQGSTFWFELKTV